MRLSLNKLMGLGLLCALGLSIPSVLGKESFEQARRGKFTTLSTKYGLMSCRNGVAEIGGGGKSGEASLRMFGGQDAEGAVPDSGGKPCLNRRGPSDWPIRIRVCFNY